MNQDNNINQYINTSIDTKSHTGTKLKGVLILTSITMYLMSFMRSVVCLACMILMEEMSHPLSIMVFLRFSTEDRKAVVLQ